MSPELYFFPPHPSPAVHDGLAGVDPAHLITYTPSLLSVSLSREVHKGAGGGKRGIYGMRSGGDNMRVASRLRDQMPKPTWMPVHTGLGLRTGTGRVGTEDPGPPGLRGGAPLWPLSDTFALCSCASTARYQCSSDPIALAMFDSVKPRRVRG